MELLIVIAIIAALAGVLMPAIKIVSEQAKASRCAKHQDQIVVAFNLYGNDNEAAVPSSLLANSRGWANLMIDYIDRSMWASAFGSARYSPMAWTQACPNFATSTNAFDGQLNSISGNNAYNPNSQLNYANKWGASSQAELACNDWGRAPTFPFTEFKFGTISKQSSRLLFGDYLNGVGGSNNASILPRSATSELDTRRHLNGTRAVVIFVDGHSERIPDSEKFNVTGGTYSR